MAHFCKLGIGNKVLKVVAVSNDVATSEQVGIDFLNNLYGTRDVWKQTSYNVNFRKNYGGKNFVYDENRDAFIEPQPYPSWILNEDTCKYDPPIEQPEGDYVWNELHRKWEAIDNS